MMDVTRQALLDRYMRLAITPPMDLFARTTIANMVAALANPEFKAQSAIEPFVLHIRENIGSLGPAAARQPLLPWRRAVHLWFGPYAAPPSSRGHRLTSTNAEPDLVNMARSSPEFLASSGPGAARPGEPSDGLRRTFTKASHSPLRAPKEPML